VRVCVLAAMAVVLCSTACVRPADRAKSPVGTTSIRLATDWRAEAEQGGFYEALATGEYARRGLAVTIVPGGPGVNVPQLVASGAV
jgi:NitT/TauT family transport system substrate-binding protein